MRKLCFIITIFLFLLTCTASAASAETYRTNNEDTGNISARTYADQLQDRFGITLLTGNECLGIPTPDTFTIQSSMASLSPFLSMSGRPDAVRELEKIDSALSRYPDGFFSFFRDSRCPGGLRILLADQIIEKDPSQNYEGYAYYDDTYYNIVLEYDHFDTLNVHHELWHSLENVILNIYPNAFSLWDQVNPEGFQYLNDFTADRSEYDPEYFVRAYGIVTPEEDRATLIEAAFYDNRDEWFARRPFLLRKLLYLNSIIHVVMDYQYEVNYKTQ